MQVSGQNAANQPLQNVQNNYSYGCNNTCTCPVGQTSQSVAAQQPAAVSYAQPVVNQYPQAVVTPASTSGVNIQIFNPSVAGPGAMPPVYNVNSPCYPANYYTGQFGPNAQAPANGQSGASANATASVENANDKPKMEKRKIVQLTDDYIKNLENYLNSKDKEVRVGAAKEVFARLEEDDSRKDDKALTALINKMLQDPSQAVRFLALAALDDRIVTGDDFTANVLKQMQTSQNGNKQDAVDAARILLKMSGKQVEKEFPAQPKKDGEKEKKPTFKV